MHSRIYIPCGRDFLALRMQRMTRPQHCHADALARKQNALLYILVGAAGMCAIGTESRDHCEKTRLWERPRAIVACLKVEVTRWVLFFLEIV